MTFPIPTPALPAAEWSLTVSLRIVAPSSINDSVVPLILSFTVEASTTPAPADPTVDQTPATHL